MNLLTLPDITNNEVVDFSTISAVTCQIMMLYSLCPCDPNAQNIARQIDAVLRSPASESLGQWKITFRQILSEWELTAHQCLYSVPINYQLPIIH